MAVDNSALTAKFDLSNQSANFQVHHIIPQELCDTESFALLMQRAGFDIDGVENGLPLPTEADVASSMGSAKHYGSHLSSYSESWRAHFNSLGMKYGFDPLNVDSVNALSQDVLDDIGSDFHSLTASYRESLSPNFKVVFDPDADEKATLEIIENKKFVAASTFLQNNDPELERQIEARFPDVEKFTPGQNYTAAWLRARDEVLSDLGELNSFQNRISQANIHIDYSVQSKFGRIFLDGGPIDGIRSNSFEKAAQVTSVVALFKLTSDALGKSADDLDADGLVEFLSKTDFNIDTQIIKSLAGEIGPGLLIDVALDIFLAQAQKMGAAGLVGAAIGSAFSPGFGTIAGAAVAGALTGAQLLNAAAELKAAAELLLIAFPEEASRINDALTELGVDLVIETVGSEASDEPLAEDVLVALVNSVDADRGSETSVEALELVEDAWSTSAAAFTKTGVGTPTPNGLTYSFEVFYPNGSGYIDEPQAGEAIELRFSVVRSGSNLIAQTLYVSTLPGDGYDLYDTASAAEGDYLGLIGSSEIVLNFAVGQSELSGGLTILNDGSNDKALEAFRVMLRDDQSNISQGAFAIQEVFIRSDTDDDTSDPGDGGGDEPGDDILPGDSGSSGDPDYQIVFANLSDTTVEYNQEFTITYSAVNSGGDAERNQTETGFILSRDQRYGDKDDLFITTDGLQNLSAGETESNFQRITLSDYFSADQLENRDYYAFVILDYEEDEAEQNYFDNLSDPIRLTVSGVPEPELPVVTLSLQRSDLDPAGEGVEGRNQWFDIISTGALKRPISVSWLVEPVEQNSVDESDFSASAYPSGTVTLSSSGAVTGFGFQLNDDGLEEGIESYRISITVLEADRDVAVVGEAGSLVATIQANDAPTEPEPPNPEPPTTSPPTPQPGGEDITISEFERILEYDGDGFDATRVFAATVVDAPANSPSISNYLLYGGLPFGNSMSVGLATSSDNASYERTSNTPLLDPTASTDLTSYRIIPERVLYDEAAENWRLYFHGNNRNLSTDAGHVQGMGMATTTDFSTWTFEPEPLLSQAGSGQGIGLEEVVRVNGEYIAYLIQSVGANPTATPSISRSNDGLAFSAPVIAPWSREERLLSAVEYGDGMIAVFATDDPTVFATGFSVNGTEFTPGGSITAQAMNIDELIIRDDQVEVWGSTGVGDVNWSFGNVVIERFVVPLATFLQNPPVWSGEPSADTRVGGPGDDTIFADDEAAIYFGTEVANQVYRLYQATLDRAPDVTGHYNWTSRLASGERTLEDVASGFVGSPEFTARFSTDLSNVEFVTLLYSNVLGTEPDDSGLARWIGELEAGSSRAQVLLGFSNSPQFKSETNAAATRYAKDSVAANWSDDVFRLYQATLDRAPDQPGLHRWTSELADGTSTLTDVAGGFVGSPEFTSRFPTSTNEAFVTLLYNNVLGTQPDVNGLARWTGEMSAGASRADVVLGFSQSPQFTAQQEASIKFWMREQGLHDRIEPGAGTNVVAGGQYADVFEFNSGEAGETTILDFQDWDYLQLNGFGYANLAQVKAQMAQDGADVRFSDNEVSIVLKNISLTDLQSDNFIDTFLIA